MALRIRMMIWKEFLQISRDPRMLAVVIALPIIMLLIYGYAINLDVKHVQVAIYDLDRSPRSRDLSNAFSHSEYFDVVGYLHDNNQVAEQLDKGIAQLVLVIPPTYSRDLARGATAQVQVLVDGSDSSSASTGVSYATLVLRDKSVKMAIAAVGNNVTASLPIDHRVRYWYNPELKSTNFIIPGLVAVILSMLAALLTSATVVRERERGTIEQLIVSPIRPLEIMIGKLVPYIIIAFGDVLLVLGAGILVFKIPLLGSPWLVILLSGLFVIASLGIGLFISTIAPTQQLALFMAVFVTQLPTILLSGFMFPLRSMPLVIQGISKIIPASHLIHALRAVFLKGSGWSMVWPAALFMLLIGLAMLAASALRFKNRLS